MDFCVEVTTRCNLECRNCFSSSRRNESAVHLPSVILYEEIGRRADGIIRTCITGGEPLLHPEIETILQLPAHYDSVGFVLSTNGTVRSDLDPLLVRHGWLAAVSLHGGADTHNRYVMAACHEQVVARLVRMSSMGVPLHVYSVLTDTTSPYDVDYLYTLRDSLGVSLLRFIIPRRHGRQFMVGAAHAEKYVTDRLDKRSVLVATSSQSVFLDVSGIVRSSH